jgi:hypothetical protein
MKPIGAKLALAIIATILFVPSFTSAAMFERPLSVGSIGPDVSLLQRVLTDTGFYFFPEITGYFGQVTLNAVADFQRSLGLDPLGYVGPATRAALNRLVLDTPSPGVPAVSAALTALVTELQQILRNQGYYQVEITGVMDPETIRAAQSIATGSNDAPRRSGGRPSRNDDDEERDTTAPILASIASSTSQTTITVTWTTDEPATSEVEYGLTGSYEFTASSSVLVTDHSVTLTGLTAATEYHFRAGSRDATGNLGTSTDHVVITSAVPDTTAPQITAIASTTSTTTVTITWTTDEPASSVILYGTSATYSATSTSLALVTNHSVTLTELTASTTYHFQLQSEDGSGNVGTSSDFILTTLQDITAFSLLQKAATKRVDFVMMGDSNQLFGGSGFDHGFGKSLAEKYEQYASAIYVPTGTDPQGYGTAGLFDPVGTGSGAPTALEAYATTKGYAYRPIGSPSFGGSNGIIIDALVSVSPLDVSASLLAHYAYGTFETGGGTFRPTWRIDTSPYTTLATAPIIDTQTGQWGIAYATLAVPAASRTTNIGAKWSTLSSGAETVVEPIMAYWSRIERPDRTTGISINTFYGIGGASLYDMAAWIEGQSDAAITNYFSAIRYLQVQAGQSPTVVVYINSGLNDRGETASPSLGPDPSSDPDSPEAYLDNLKGIIQRIEDIWVLNGWNQDELAFLIVPSHPVSTPDDMELVAYRSAVEAYAATRARISFVDVSELITANQLQASGYYDASGVAHLTQSGYEALAELITDLF